MSPPELRKQDEGANSSAGLQTLRVILKNWPIIAACTLLAGGGSLLYAKSQRRIYQASALVKIDPHVQQPLGEKTQGVLELGAGYGWDTRDYYETQYRLITSDRILGAVVKNEDLKLAKHVDVSAQNAGIDPVEAAIGELRTRVVVEPVKYSRLVMIKVEDPDQRMAKKLADAIAEAYKINNLDSAHTSSNEAVVWLRGQVGTVRSDLERNENALHEFKKRHELPSTSINEASNMVRLEMQAHTEGLSRTRSRKQEISARHIELSKIADNEPDELPASELLNNVYLQKLRGDYQTAVKEKKELLSRKDEGHPEVQAVNARIVETRTALLREVRNIKGAVERDLAIVQRQESGEFGLFESARKRAVDLNMKEIEYRRLDRAREQNEKLYGFLLERLKDADLAVMMQANNVDVVDYAPIPRVPIRPRASLAVSVGLLLGLLFGLVLAWVREQLDRSLKTPDEVEDYLGVPFLGLLPVHEETGRNNDKKRSRRVPLTKPPELVVHERPLSSVAEAARTIRTNLLFMNPDHPYQAMLVSSAAPSEGKTTIACSLAIALAQSGQRVCIIDCDLRRPRLHRIFDRKGDAGVTNVVVGDATVEEVAQPTEIDNLWSIPAGPIPPNPADLLHSERFRKFLRDVRSRFDRVIIDSPPLVAVTDGAIISKLVDGCVFVVRAGKTDKHVAQQGVRALRDVSAQVAGVVLNAVNFGKHEYSRYYQYYAYRQDGYGPRDDDGSDDGGSPKGGARPDAASAGLN